MTSVQESSEICGQGMKVGRFVAGVGFGCGRPFNRPEDIYRCYDCTIAFHRGCLKQHCKEKPMLERMEKK